MYHEAYKDYYTMILFLCVSVCSLRLLLGPTEEHPHHLTPVHLIIHQTPEAAMQVRFHCQL